MNDDIYENPNIESGKRLIQGCLEPENMDWIKEMTNLPDIDGALFGLYVGHVEQGMIAWNGWSFMVPPEVLKELMKAACALGFYKQREIENNTNIWEIGE